MLCEVCVWCVRCVCVMVSKEYPCFYFVQNSKNSPEDNFNDEIVLLILKMGRPRLGTLGKSLNLSGFSFSFNYLFIYFCLCWVFVSVRGLSPVAASGGHSSSRCAGLSLSRSLLLQSTSSRRAGSVVVAHGPSCSAACGIFPNQGSNPCPLHWQADSQPLRHQGSPGFSFSYLYSECVGLSGM